MNIFMYFIFSPYYLQIQACRFFLASLAFLNFSSLCVYIYRQILGLLTNHFDFQIIKRLQINKMQIDNIMYYCITLRIYLQLLKQNYVFTQLYNKYMYKYVQTYKLMFCLLSFDTLQELLFVCPTVSKLRFYEFFIVVF